MAVNEVELHKLVKEFDSQARSKRDDPTAPATVAELENAITWMSHTLDMLISKLVQ